MIYNFAIHEGAWARHDNGEYFLCTVSEKLNRRLYKVIWFDDHHEATVCATRMKKLKHVNNNFLEHIAPEQRQFYEPALNLLEKLREEKRESKEEHLRWLRAFRSLRADLARAQQEAERARAELNTLKGL